MHAVVVVIIGIGWVVFWTLWLIAAFTAKASRGSLARFSALRIVLIVGVIYFLLHPTRGEGAQRLDGPVLAGVGLALWAAGLALALWARFYIGRNWGMPMTRRQEPELVTTGPYRFIRHPIYTGIILGFAGTALTTTPVGLIWVAVIAGFFIYFATREEEFLAGQFPDTFPAYKARTKMLIPFIL